MQPWHVKLIWFLVVGMGLISTCNFFKHQLGAAGNYGFWKVQVYLGMAGIRAEGLSVYVRLCMNSLFLSRV